MKLRNLIIILYILYIAIYVILHIIYVTYDIVIHYIAVPNLSQNEHVSRSFVFGEISKVTRKAPCEPCFFARPNAPGGWEQHKEAPLIVRTWGHLAAGETCSGTTRPLTDAGAFLFHPPRFLHAALLPSMLCTEINIPVEGNKLPSASEAGGWGGLPLS